MEKLMKKFFRSSIITSAVLIILGLLLFFQPDRVIITISYIIGAVLVSLGVVGGIRFIRKTNTGTTSELDIVYGVVSVILGVLVIKNPKAIGSIIPAILGISIIISSASKLQYAFELRTDKNDLWKSTMIISILSTICGIVLLFNPFKAISNFTKIVGAFIVVYSILDIISTVTIKRNFKIYQERKKITEAVIIEEEDDNEATAKSEDEGSANEVAKIEDKKSKKRRKENRNKKED